jgi:hypothetical protein
MTKLHHHHHTTGFGMAFGLPINDAIQSILQSARDLDDSANKVAKERDQHARNDFGQRIAGAVKRKVAKQPTRITAAAADESFGEKLRKAIERKSPRHDAAAVFAAAPAKEDDDDDDDKEKNGDNESFGQRIKKAVEKRSGQKQHKEYAERERESLRACEAATSHKVRMS